MAIKSVGPDPTVDEEVGSRGYNDGRYALKSEVGAGSAESVLTQNANTQLTSAALTALTAGTATKVGSGHTVTSSGITVPAGTYTLSNQVEFNNAAARTLTYVGVRVVGSTTTDYLSTVMPAASVNVEGTWTLELTEASEIRPLIQTTQTTATNRVVKAVADSRLRVISNESMPAGEPNTIITSQVNALRDPPSVQVVRTSAQTIPTNAVTYIQWQAAEHDSVPNGQPQWALGGDVTCRQDGVYLIDATWPWAGSNAGTLRTMYIFKNGTANNNIIAVDVRPASAGDTANNIIIKKRMVAGDYLRIAVFQDTGGSSASGLLYGIVALLGMTYLRP